MSATFVVGSGRCGSTLLSTLLHLHPQALSLSELLTALSAPKLFAHRQLDGAQLATMLSSQDEQLRDYLRAGPMSEVLQHRDERGEELAPLLLATLPRISPEPSSLHELLMSYVRPLPRASLAEQLERVFGFLAVKLGRTHWVERSGNVLEYVEHVQAHWPAGRFVYLLRNGPECALSMSRHPAFRVRVARLVAREATLPVVSCLAMKVPPHRYGAYWSALMVNKLLPSIRAAKPENVHVLRYEQLLEEPARQLGALFKFIGLDEAAPSLLEEMSRTVRPLRTGLDDLSQQVHSALMRACRPGTRALEAVIAHASRDLGCQAASGSGGSAL